MQNIVLKHLPEQRAVVVHDKTVILTKLENHLLAYFLEHINQVCDIDELLTNVWPPGRSPSVVEKAVNRLRDKIEKDANNPEFLFSVRGEGYILRLGQGELTSVANDIFEEWELDLWIDTTGFAQKLSEKIGTRKDPVFGAGWTTIFNRTLLINDIAPVKIWLETAFGEDDKTADQLNFLCYVKWLQEQNTFPLFIKIEWGRYMQKFQIRGHGRIPLAPINLNDIVIDKQYNFPPELMLTVAIEDDN
ncbi:MAG TPA: winged helix-turn-helix domain-containing protein [Anaerolineae bacterium]|nr:winged helix-turn-helix domain-containing protein [Anaerolineae bacterium]